MNRAAFGGSAVVLAAVVLGGSVLAACGSSDDGSNGGKPTSGEGGTSENSSGGNGNGDGAGQDTTVVAFDKTPIYFTDKENKRIVDLPATFPTTGTYEKIILHLSLSCPSEGCDPWDRFGSLGLVTEKSADGTSDKVVEIQRFITPYHVGASWDLDVTDLRPILSGDVTLRGFIDTWVGPGSQYGGGWLLSASFEMTGGVPSRVPVAAIPVWNMLSAVYGDPTKPIDQSVPPTTLTLPEATSYELRAFVTGHGQGNLGNCAEFCSKKHTLKAGTASHDETIWRTDCETTAAPKQQGTWKYPRAGWCPGADVRPWSVDVTADVTAGGSTTFAYDVEAFENTCRPGVTECTGCTLGASCEYDGGSHTEPNYSVSALLIAFR